jgi:outer membrane murein-binding lipoprotein Lpp
MRWRTLLPLAAVAAGAILYAGAHNQTPVSQSWHQVKTSDLKLSELDSYLDLMVSRHLAAKKPLQPMLFSPEERLEPPFQLPPIQDIRMANFGDAVQRSNSGTPVFCGSSSVYRVRGHRVTFCAYEAAAAPLRARLEGYSLRGHVVYAGRRQGYSVATVEDGPVGYAMTSDLSPLESADVIAAAVESRVQH